jgi:hypothetical protein
LRSWQPERARSIGTTETLQWQLSPGATAVGERSNWLLFALTIIILTFGTVYLQEKRLGLDYLETTQLARHEAVLNGTAPNPWAYRVLSEYAVEGFILTAKLVHVSRPVAGGFIAFRLVQNAFLFSLALIFYQLLGLTVRDSYIGIVLLSYAITFSWFHSDLSFNTYGDVFFYLLAGCVVFAQWSLWWLLPISFLAALNRETSLFISFFPVASLIGTWGRNWRSFIPRIRITAACLLVQVGTLTVLRMMIHTGNLPWQQMWHNEPGWETLRMNLTSSVTLELLGLTLSVLPIAVLWNFRELPAWLKGMFWIMVPAWFTVHFLMVYANETRIFLVPAALIFIPAALHRRT